MVKYFLGANSGEGFISNFQKCYEPRDGWRAFIIKGGPGTGKSSFMKKIAETAESRGFSVEYCPCSSDPDSLDAVIIPQIKTAVMDGTSPHTVDPVYPGKADSILNFGDFWNEELLKDESIIDLTDKNRTLHKTASLYIKNAGALKRKNAELVLQNTDSKKLERYCEKLCSKSIKGKGKGYRLEEYFLSGITPKGKIYYYDTVLNNTQNIVILRDDFGGIATKICESFIAKCREKDFKVISYKNYLEPSFYDAIYIPELMLAVIVDSKSLPIKSECRRVHINRFLKGDYKKNQIKFNQKVIDVLLNKAVETLQSAKNVHDELETVYIKAMDYKKLDKFTNEFADKNI